MIRFHRIFELNTDADRRRFAEAAEVFRSAFPHEAQGIDQIGEFLCHRQSINFDPILLVSADRQHRVTGLAFVFYFFESALWLPAVHRK